MALFERSMTVGQELLDSSPAAAGTAAAVVPPWGPVKRIAFRFVFSYLVLYLFSAYVGLLYLLLDFIPAGAVVVSAVAGWYESLWAVLVPWVGRHLFGVAATSHPTGSGDTAFGYVRAFCILVVALAAMLVWTVLDRKRPHYARLSAWLRVYVRFGLATTMIEYGAVKVVPAQFSVPSLDRLVQPFGDSSPMGLLWTFMGASKPYTMFAGGTELLGGLLLAFRRTTLLGALVCIAALTNVVVLNFCYDVPVKLFSSHLLAMAFFLAAPDLGRLANLLVLNRPVAPAVDRPLFRRRWLRLGATILSTVFIAAYTVYMLKTGQEERKIYGDLAPWSPLRGIWNVDTLQVDGRPGPPPGAADLQWRRVIFDRSGAMAIQLTSESRRRYVLKMDGAKKTLALAKRDDPAWKSALTYSRPAPDRLTLEGTFEGHKVQASLHSVAIPEFLLNSRGFHWVAEYPFHR